MTTSKSPLRIPQVAYEAPCQVSRALHGTNGDEGINAEVWDQVPVRRHIAGIFGEILGVDIRDNRPSCTSYPGDIDLYSPVPCAPCWLTELCPFGHPCLHQITPQQVDEAVKQLWEHKNHNLSHCVFIC